MFDLPMSSGLNKFYLKKKYLEENHPNKMIEYVSISFIRDTEMIIFQSMVQFAQTNWNLK